MIIACISTSQIPNPVADFTRSEIRFFTCQCIYLLSTVTSFAGTSTWTVYRDTAILGHNIDANTLYGIHDVQRCLDACEANPACGAVDYTPLSGACYMNYVTGMEYLILKNQDI